MTPSADAVADRLATVRAEIAVAAERGGRDPGAVRILAVTKGHGLDTVVAALASGLRDVGESRVQEAATKVEALRGRDVRWHMVGHLQRNKARVAAGLFDTVHSVDSVALGGALIRGRPAGRAPLRALVEVDLTGLPSRSGTGAADAGAVLRSLMGQPSVEPVGLMTIAPPRDPDAARACFARLRGLRDELQQSTGAELGELSMGMSDDFAIAVEEGATIVRLGTALFGARAGPGWDPAKSRLS